MILQTCIYYSDFLSLKFSLLYLSLYIPSNVRISALQYSDEFFDIEDAISNVVELINRQEDRLLLDGIKEVKLEIRVLLMRIREIILKKMLVLDLLTIILSNYIQLIKIFLIMNPIFELL